MENQDDAEYRPDAKRMAIYSAAVAEFSQRGFAATSMANIADAAGMSRPALYQYFKNKGDIFVSAFVSLMADHIARALAALETPGSTVEHIDSFLQRFDGDLWEHMAASPHSEEIIGFKSETLQHDLGVAVTQLWQGLRDYLRKRGVTDTVQLTDWVDVLHFSPKGFKLDQPSIETFRRRLTTLASAVAKEIDATLMS